MWPQRSQMAAVIYWQRCWRGFTARRLHALMVRVYTKACNNIGWWYLGCLDRIEQQARFARARRGAIKIQSHIRKYLAIKYVAWMRTAYNKAALLLQVSRGAVFLSAARASVRRRSGTRGCR